MPTDFQEFYYSSTDGLRLHGRKYGWHNHDHTPLVCLAGLTRNSQDFDTLAKWLASEEGGSRRVLTLDYRGRGKSEFDPKWENYNILQEADDTLAGITAAGLGHINLLGTSRGGLIAMILAASRPGILKSVILNDIGPALNGPGLVRIKRNMQQSSMPKTLKDAARNLQRNYATSFPKLSEKDWEHEAALTYREENGKLVLRYDPKLLNTLKSINLDVPLITLWDQFRGLAKIPLMLIHGKLSDLLTDDIIEGMQEIHRTMHVHTVLEEGHAPLLRDPETMSAISRFIKAKK